ncbi:MAG TPA: hypothetical protein VHL99_09700, partial [Candidatus Binatia bacterium]|nr:hypothetical protein [Candidatus Binatia bacterium]
IPITLVRDRKVEVAVAVEVGGDEKNGCRRERKNRCCGRKRSVAIAENNGDVFTYDIRDRHVELAVAVEVADSDAARRGSSGQEIDGFFRKRERLRKARRGNRKREDSEKSGYKDLEKTVLHEQTARSYAIIGRMTSTEK